MAKQQLKILGQIKKVVSLIRRYQALSMVTKKKSVSSETEDYNPNKEDEENIISGW